MRRAGAVVLIGALVAGGVATVVVAAWRLGEAPVVVPSRPPTDTSADVGEPTARPVRSHVDPAVATDAGDTPTRPVDDWLRGVCGDGGPLRLEDGTAVEWWDLPLEDVVAGLLAAATSDDLEWSAARALAELRGIGYLAAPWAADVAALLADPSLREEAAVTLAGMGPDALPVLRRAAGDDDPGVRAGALRALAEATYRRREVVEIALAALSDADRDVRLRAIEALAAHPEEPSLSVPALAALVASGEDDVQREVLAALLHHGPRAAGAVPALIGLVGDRRSRRVGDATTVLMAIGPAAEPAVPTLLSLYAGEPELYAKTVPAALVAISPDAFLATLSDDRAEVRAGFAMRAHLVVGEHPERTADVLAALARLDADPSADVRGLARVGRHLIEQKEVERHVELQHLSQRLAESGEPAGRKRVRALRRIRDLGIVARPLAPAVRELLGEPDEAVRVAAATTVWVIDPPATDVLATLESFRTHPELRVVLLQSLLDRPPPSWADFLVRLLRDEPDGSAAIGAANALVERLGERALDPLVRWASAETTTYRLAWIADLLGRIGRPARAALVELSERPGLPPPLRAELLRRAEEAR